MRALSAEAALLALATGTALIAGANTSSFASYLLIASTALAMGLRNAVVRKLAVPDLTTTVLTMTITGLAADSWLAGGTSPREGRRMLAILIMTGGALVGTLLLRTFGMWVSLLVADVSGWRFCRGSLSARSLDQHRVSDTYAGVTRVATVSGNRTVTDQTARGGGSRQPRNVLTDEGSRK